MGNENFETLVGTLAGMSVALGIILGAAVTAGFNILAKKIDFTNDYFKRIIDKRMNACNALEYALIPFTTKVRNQQNQEAHEFMYRGYERTDKPGTIMYAMHCFAELNIAFSANKHWVSSELGAAIQNILNLSPIVDGDCRHTQFQMNKMDKETFDAGTKHFDLIETALKEGFSMLQKEHETAWDVPGFLKKRGHHIPNQLNVVLSEVWLNTLKRKNK